MIVAAILRAYMNEDILEVIYQKIQTRKSEGKINNTYYTQPAMFVIEYAMAKLWMSWGVRPTAFIGHSIGEFVAAHLAGVFSLERWVEINFYARTYDGGIASWQYACSARRL